MLPPIINFPFWIHPIFYWIFLSELPITTLAILIWLSDSAWYLGGLSTLYDGYTDREYLLLIGWSIVTFYTVVLINGFFLWRMRPSLWGVIKSDRQKKIYTLFQIGMLSGDIAMIFIFAVYDWINLNPVNSSAAATVIVAGAYGIVRIVFIYSAWTLSESKQILS